MTILDRYILRLFLLNFAILAAVFSLLFVVINVIVDLDEFLEAGQTFAEAGRFGSAWMGTLWAVVDYNAPVVVLLYVFFCGLLVVAAMGFTFAALHRTGELTAMLSGGISLYRALVPVLLVGALLSAAALPLQEFVIPQLAQALTRSKSEIVAPKARARQLSYVGDDAGNLLSAGQFDAATGTLQDVTILERDARGLTVLRVQAPQAVWDEAVQAWLLEGGVGVQPGPVVPGGPARHVPRHAFHTTLTPQALLARQASAYPRFLSLRQLERLADNPVVEGDRMRQIMHSRFSLLVLNVLVLVMGFRFFLLREPANMLVQGMKAAGLCIGAWGMGLVILEKTGGAWLNPAAAAWLPVCLLLPVSVALLRGLRT